MRTSHFAWVLIALLPGCNCDNNQGLDAGVGLTVSGQLVVFQGAQSTPAGPTLGDVLTHEKNAALVSKLRGLVQTPKLEVVPPSAQRHSQTEWIAGEIIVRFLEKLPASQALERVTLGPSYRVRHGGFASEYLHLLKVTFADGAPLTAGHTLELAQSLRKTPGVRFTEVNQWQHSFAVPNDKLYSAQWHYPAINLPAAWDITTGSSTVVVADIDTGVVPNPDLDPRLISGIDMISDVANAGDGDERDQNPLDQGGDEPNGGSSWHGTHTAGTIGAATNNDLGVAGVDWKARLMPVRVLGVKGGALFDIAAGITWATGGNVPGVGTSSTPAKVANLSLGGVSDASPTYQDAIDAANARGSVIVVAAGNSNEDARRTIPCIQQNLICVGATRFSGARASYSNFGAAVTLMAPGGELAEDANGDGYPDGVLSTFRDKDNMPSIAFNQGTSMATPHVTGVVALMFAVNPTMTFNQARNFLVNTASAGSKCNEGCGAGLINAQAAVLAAKGQPPTGPAKLSTGTTELFFTNATPSLTLSVSNLGGQPLTVTAASSGTAASALSFPKGATLTLAGGQSGGLEVLANLSTLGAGVHPAAVELTSNGGAQTVNVRIKIGGAGSTQPASVGLAFQDSTGAWKVAGKTTATAESGYRYSVTAPAGRYYVVAVIDENGNGMFEDSEPVGIYPTTDSPEEVVISATVSVENANFSVVPNKPIASNPVATIGGACTSSCPDNGVCVTAWPGGYCSRACDTTSCPVGSACSDTGNGAFCLSTCTGPGAGQSTCRPSYVCYDDGTGKGLCLPACTTNTDCGTNGTCNVASGYCN